MGGTLSPYPALWFPDNNGDPAVGYQLFTYASGTSTKLATYSDAELTTPNTNPVILDSAARCTLYLLPAAYKYVLAPPDDTDPPTSPLWTRDPVSAVSPFTVFQDVSGTAGEDLTAREPAYLADGTEGGTVAGRWYKTDASATNTSTNAVIVGFVVSDAVEGAEVSIRMSGRMEGYGSLIIGAVYFLSEDAGEISTSPPAKKRGVAQADTATSLLIMYGMGLYVP